MYCCEQKLKILMKGKVMKKLVGNNLVCIGDFCGPDIEEGTFHEGETPDSVSHKSKIAQKCPCPPN